MVRAFILFYFIFVFIYLFYFYFYLFIYLFFFFTSLMEALDGRPLPVRRAGKIFLCGASFLDDRLMLPCSVEDSVMAAGGSLAT